MSESGDHLRVLSVTASSPDKQDFMKLIIVSSIAAILGLGAGFLIKATIQEKPKLALPFPVLLVDSLDVSVKSEDKRLHTIPIEIPELLPGSAKLRIGLFHCLDDSGDKGMTYELTDKGGQMLDSGTKSGREWDWIETNVQSGDKLQFVVKDEDTSFKGVNPGNIASLQIQLWSK